MNYQVIAFEQEQRPKHMNQKPSTRVFQDMLKIGMIQRRLAKPQRMDDTMNI